MTVLLRQQKTNNSCCLFVTSKKITKKYYTKRLKNTKANAARVALAFVFYKRTRKNMPEINNDLYANFGLLGRKFTISPKFYFTATASKSKQASSAVFII